MLQQLQRQYDKVDCRDLGSRQLELLRNGLKEVEPDEIKSAADGKAYITLLRKFREAVAENDKLHGDNYPSLLNSILSVGEDGLYSNNLRFIFELIQNVDDCDYPSPEDCHLDMQFDFNNNKIVLTYNEVGFTPFNVFAITGIAEAAKNISSSKDEIGEKGIGFKSVFGVASKVLIRSGWFSFELYKENFTIPVLCYQSEEFCKGTQMTLYVPDRAKQIYSEIKKQYCQKEALFSRNPLLFLNKLTTLKIYFDTWRSMEFHVSRTDGSAASGMVVEKDIEISVDLHDYESGREIDIREQIKCARYSMPVVFSRNACQSRYGDNTKVGSGNGKRMILRVVFPNPEYISDVGEGSLYSFLPTQLKFNVPVVCHVPFKLDASREFVDPQEENLWFREASRYLAELLDKAYMDWRTVVKENIVQYLPGARDNLFAKNNGKEKCLSQQNAFSGAHYLSLPLFLTVDGAYHKADDISCFDYDEEITDPIKVYRMLELQSFLFVPPISVSKFWLHTERNIKERLFRKALSKPALTEEILDYLDSVDYSYTEKLITGMEQFALTGGQIIAIIQHQKAFTAFQEVARKSILGNTRPKFLIESDSEQRLSEVLFEDFDISETPKQVERYISYCKEACVCLDIGEDCYLPCYNGIVLSMTNPVSSFAAFCYSIDQRDTFAIRIKLREASKRLNYYVEQEVGTASEYLRDLRNIRLLIKESLGNTGYRNYIDLILKSGTERGRFIQELLQNADDCDYPKGVTPSFELSQRENSVFTGYNEVGFTRANIRSLTAIGESTKNKLFNGQLAAIGEKGVGFKTVFAIASKVKIQSGEFSFELTDREPTIPRALKNDDQKGVNGTRMELVLKERNAFPNLKERDLLELCLCLRKLRLIRIGEHTVTIEDSEDHRTITVDRRQYVFKRFIHTFTVTDERALIERKNGIRAISPEQAIVCYVPERGGRADADFPLYNGLPTKHRIKIPMAIDAPFALTTSREEIETDSSAWNNAVRGQLYTAVLSVIDALKGSERSRVLRFTRFVPRFQGNIRVYVNDISDCNYLTEYDFLRVLKGHPILPTFDENTFQAPNANAAYRFPEVANYLFRSNSQSRYVGIKPGSIIDVEGTDFEAALNAFECKSAPFGMCFPIIRDYAEKYIRDDNFNEKLYEYLQDTPTEYKDEVRRLAIIPVFGRFPETVDYIPWKDDSIFVKSGVSVSGNSYYILNVKMLSKSACEKIFDANINEMTPQWERNRYNERLKDIIRGKNMQEIYRHLLSEFSKGAFQRYDSFSSLLDVRELIPLKNETGELVDTTLFICEEPEGYFPVKMLQDLIVNRECRDFAEYLRCEEISGIHYEDVNYYTELTADDVEALLDDYFDHSEEILSGFYKDGYLSDDLLKEYNLDYLAIGHVDDYYDADFDFPSVPVGNRTFLAAHIQKQWQNPVKVVPVKVERTVRRGQNADGSTFDLGINDARNGALRTYTPEGVHQRCFCQMCKKVKPYNLMEVNNIEVLPQYYFPQLRVALCLECSKRFEYLRSNAAVRDEYMESIKNAHIQAQGVIEIPLGPDETIRFTAKHLAEIQEILKRMPRK